MYRGHKIAPKTLLLKSANQSVPQFDRVQNSSEPVLFEVYVFKLINVEERQVKSRSIRKLNKFSRQKC